MPWRNRADAATFFEFNGQTSTLKMVDAYEYKQFFRGRLRTLWNSAAVTQPRMGHFSTQRSFHSSSVILYSVQYPGAQLISWLLGITTLPRWFGLLCRDINLFLQCTRHVRKMRTPRSSERLWSILVKLRNWKANRNGSMHSCQHALDHTVIHIISANGVCECDRHPKTFRRITYTKSNKWRVN